LIELFDQKCAVSLVVYSWSVYALHIAVC